MTFVVLAACALVVLVLLWLALVAIHAPRHDDDDGHWWGWGGGGSRRPDPEGPRSPNRDPDWWPEFEQQFAAYVALQRELPVQIVSSGNGTRPRVDRS
jgi:hypothetical protein